MKYVVTMIMCIDPKEYHAARNTPREAIRLVAEILKNEADWPDGIIQLICDDESAETDADMRDLRFDKKPARAKGTAKHTHPAGVSFHSGCGACKAERKGKG